MNEENKNEEFNAVEEEVDIEEPILDEAKIPKIEDDDKDEYTQEDLITEPVKHIEHDSVIGDEVGKHHNIVEEASESMKRTDGTKIWVIFNTFVSILTLMFVIMIFATQMITPV